MQVDIRRLCEAISEPRIKPYRQQPNGSDSLACGTYAWNIAMCESLYPALNCLEVVLRNSIQQAAATAFGNEFWFDCLTLNKSKDAVCRARKELQDKSAQKPMSAGDLVAGLNFGFWVGLFDRRYEQQLWPKLLDPVFPHIPRRLRRRKFLSIQLHQIRWLRNRIFHHEPIWNRDNLSKQHGQILDTIGWVNRDMRNLVEMLDRFPQIHARGAEAYEGDLTSTLQT